MKVLVVDDSRILQERLLGLIKGCERVSEIDQKFNTIEAKDILERKNYDIVISDIRMPGGGGFDLLEHIRKTYNNIITIIITNYPYPQYREKAEELGADYFLSKSDDLDKLVSILDELSASYINK